MDQYKVLHQRILDDEGFSNLNKQEYEIPDMDTIRKKIALIEDQEIRDESEFLPSEYSAKKSPRKRKRKDYSAAESQSVTSKISTENPQRKRKGKRASKRSKEDQHDTPSEFTSERHIMKKDSKIKSETREMSLSPEQPRRQTLAEEMAKSLSPDSIQRQNDQYSRQNKGVLFKNKAVRTEMLPPKFQKIEEVEDEHKNLETIDSHKNESKIIKLQDSDNSDVLIDSSQSKSKIQGGSSKLSQEMKKNEYIGSVKQIDEIDNQVIYEESKSNLQSSTKGEAKTKLRKSQVTNYPILEKLNEVEISLNEENAKDDTENVQISDNMSVEEEVKSNHSQKGKTPVRQNQGDIIVTQITNKEIKMKKKKKKTAKVKIKHKKTDKTDKTLPSKNLHEELKIDRDNIEQHEQDEEENEPSTFFKMSKKSIGKVEQVDDEMECEGGQMEEEEQSESSNEDHDDIEGEESEGSSQQNNNINIMVPRAPISIKDIDKEFWRILHSYRPEINQLQLETNQIRDSIKEHCKIVSDENVEQINNLEKKIELDFKEQMIYIKTLQSDIEVATKRFKREKTDFTLETQTLHKRVEECENKMNYVHSSIKTLSLLCSAIIENINIEQAIQEQDEVDKRGISLMGVKQEMRDDTFDFEDNKRLDKSNARELKTHASVGSNIAIPSSPNTSLKHKIHVYTKRRFTALSNNQREYNEETGAQNVQIKLNKQCLTCAGNSSVVLNAFKIACLAYSPSTVGYRSNVYSRDFLLSVKRQIMNYYWSLCINCPPFTENHDANVDLIYENVVLSMSKPTTMPPIKMRDPQIYPDDNSGQFTMRAGSRNKNIFNNSNLVSKNNLQSSTNFLSPVMGSMNSEVSLSKSINPMQRSQNQENEQSESARHMPKSSSIGRKGSKRTTDFQRFKKETLSIGGNLGSYSNFSKIIKF